MTGSEVAVTESTLEVGNSGFVFKNLDDLERLATSVIKNRMAPKCYTSPGQLVVAMQTGAEVGLTPMVSLRWIYVVPDSGVPSWTSEACRALIRRGFYNPMTGKVTGVLHPGTDLEEGVWHSHEVTENKNDCTNDCHGWTKSHPRSRNGDSVKTTFSVALAKQAGLWGNPKKFGWQKWVDRMLMHRSTAFHCRDYYGGVLGGLMTQDEAEEAAHSSVPHVLSRQIDPDAGPSRADPLFSPQEANTEVFVGARVGEGPVAEIIVDVGGAEVCPSAGCYQEPDHEGDCDPFLSAEDREEPTDTGDLFEEEIDPATGEVIPDDVR